VFCDKGLNKIYEWSASFLLQLRTLQDFSKDA